MASQRSNFQEEVKNLPLVDEDAPEVSDEDSSASRVNNETESMPSSGIGSPITGPECK